MHCTPEFEDMMIDPDADLLQLLDDNAISDTFELPFQSVIVDADKVIENSQKENEPLRPIDDNNESVVLEDILNDNNNEKDITQSSATVIATVSMCFSDTNLSIPPQPLDETEDVAIKVASPSFEAFRDPSMIKSCARIENDNNIDNDLPALRGKSLRKENESCLPPLPVSTISMIGSHTAKITPVTQQTTFSTNNFSFSRPNIMSTTISRIPIRSNCGLAISSAPNLRAPLPPNGSNIFDASLNKSGDNFRNNELSFDNDNMSCYFARKRLRITLGYDLKERLKQKTALLSEKREMARMLNENENGACEENDEIGSEIVGKESHLDFPNISIPNISIEALDKFSDVFEDISDGDVQQLSRISEENLPIELNQIKETVSRPILSLEASPSATANPHNGLTQSLLEKTFCDLHFTLYNNMLNEESSIIEYEPEMQPLDELKSFANNDALYHCLEKLDFNALKLRIYAMKPHECVIRFLWGTVEVRINFYEVFSSTGVRRMEFSVISLLKCGQPISEQVLRDIDLPDSELSLYNGDHQPCIIDEKDRSILQIGHKYILTQFDEKYRQLHKDYPDSSKLLELIHELSQTANIARSMVTELLYIYKSSVVELLPPDGERFRFNLTLLGEPLGSEFDLVFSFDPLNYPHEVIHPTIVLPDKYQHIYPLDQFKAAFLSEKPGENYLKRQIKVAKLFVKAIRYVRNKNRRLEKQKLQIAAATLPQPPPTPPTNKAAN